MPPEILVQDKTEISPITPREFIPRSELTRKALAFATLAHEGQWRKSGEAYIEHPKSVSYILQDEWGIPDQSLVAAGLLHDVIEDGEGITVDTIRQEFGEDIANLVDSVSQLRSKDHELTDEEMLKLLAERGYIDPRVFLLKIADRLHNMRTLDAVTDPEKRAIKANETLRVYTRVAESLGMWSVKIELEDLAFRYVNPQWYAQIKEEVDNDPRLNTEFIQGWVEKLEELLARRNFHGKVEYRINGYYALAKKREHSARIQSTSTDSFADINDMVSFRVRLAHEEDCYALLGPIHLEFKPYIAMDRFDEFIVDPRVNNYQALQTTYISDHGPIEIALVTFEMEEFNNWGIVSLMRARQENLDDYVLKVVFTPAGKAIFLDKDAMGIDFAYAVNPSLGANAVGVCADGIEYKLTDTLPNSATVEVITGSARRAPEIAIPETAMPYTKIMMREQKRLAQRDDRIKAGREILQDALSPIGLRELKDLPSKSQKIIFDFGCQNLEELYFRIGSGSIVPERITGWFESEGLNKETLGLTTIEVSGKDQPGIMDDLASWIKRFGGNIVGIDHKREEEGFFIRIVVEKMNSKGERRLSSKVRGDKRFDTKIVV